MSFKDSVEKNLNLNKNAICLISGGLDSAVSTAVAQKLGYSLNLLFVNYGQKTLKKEYKCVKKLEKYFKPNKLLILNFRWLKMLGQSGLFDTKTILNEGNFKLEYVPFRNSILISAATAWAETIGADAIFVGSSGGDHICPDNSPVYLKAFQKVISIGTMLKKNIKIKAPLIHTDKKGAILIGKKLHVPFHLTWSCHNNLNTACEHCSNCKARLEAFQDLGMTDPIEYDRS